MTIFFKQIQIDLKGNATPAGKAAAEKFVPGATKIYGVRTPVLNVLAKKYKNGGFVLVKELWKSGAFEERLLAAKLLNVICRQDPQKALAIVSAFSHEIDNWAVCDAVGMQSLKPVAQKIQSEIFDLSDSLMNVENFWERRLSLVLLEYFTRYKEHHIEIMKRVKQLENDDAYYVKKAVVWIKRNFEKGR